MIKAAFFDFFNTLGTVVPSLEEMNQQALSEFGLQIPLPVISLAYVEADRLWAVEQSAGPLDRRPAVERERVHISYEQIVLRHSGIDVSDERALAIFQRYLEVTPRWTLYEDVLPTIGALRVQGLLTGLITNIGMGPRNAGGAGVRRMEDALTAHGLTPLLDIIVTSDQVGVTKPDKRIFQEGLRRANVAPNEALFVGDQLEADVKGALSAGIHPLLLDRESAYSDLTDVPRIATLREVIEYMRRFEG